MPRTGPALFLDDQCSCHCPAPSSSDVYGLRLPGCGVRWRRQNHQGLAGTRLEPAGTVRGPALHGATRDGNESPRLSVLKGVASPCPRGSGYPDTVWADTKGEHPASFSGGFTTIRFQWTSHLHCLGNNRVGRPGSVRHLAACAAGRVRVERCTLPAGSGEARSVAVTVPARVAVSVTSRNCEGRERGQSHHRDGDGDEDPRVGVQQAGARGQVSGDSGQ